MSKPLALQNQGVVARILNGLLQKANVEELRTLQSFLHNKTTDEPSLLSRILSEEINKHTR